MLDGKRHGLHTDILFGRFMRYRIALHQSDEEFSVSVPGLHGCWLQGSTEVNEQLRGKEVHEIEVTV